MLQVLQPIEDAGSLDEVILITSGQWSPLGHDAVRTNAGPDSDVNAAAEAR